MKTKTTETETTRMLLRPLPEMWTHKTGQRMARDEVGVEGRTLQLKNDGNKELWEDSSVACGLVASEILTF